jgi:hypothetical protein
MEFIQGVKLHEIFTRDNSRLWSKDISDEEVEVVHRQIEKFRVQMYAVYFDWFGSLPTRSTKSNAPLRPLTWKAHEIFHQSSLLFRLQLDTNAFYNSVMDRNSIIFLFNASLDFCSLIYLGEAKITFD